MIYACEEDNLKLKGLLKIGFASADVERRKAEQFPVLKLGGRKPYRAFVGWPLPVVHEAPHRRLPARDSRLDTLRL